MAKRDPAFLFYDADAARDVSHMTRLERGAYFDFIQAQRKFGGCTVEQARKILGKDFDEVWSALELVLSVENSVFFIQWVRDSMKNRTEHAEKQRERIQNYWDKKKKEEEERKYHGTSVEVPLVIENEIAIENEIVLNKKGVDSEFTKMDSKAAAIAKTLILARKTPEQLFQLFTQAYAALGQEVTESRHGSLFYRLGELAVLATADIQARAEAGTIPQPPKKYLTPYNGEYGWHRDIHRSNACKKESPSTDTPKTIEKSW